jgi:hypothetical protein
MMVNIKIKIKIRRDTIESTKKLSEFDATAKASETLSTATTATAVSAISYVSETIVTSYAAAKISAASSYAAAKISAASSYADATATTAATTAANSAAAERDWQDKSFLLRNAWIYCRCLSAVFSELDNILYQVC